MDKLPFIPNQLYNRRADILAVYGGNWQSGICPSAKYPYIFIFTGTAGHQHGYRDGWDNPNVFTYTGEGQSGDMEFTRGNLALRDHLKNGKRVFLFESENTGFVSFICEVDFFDDGSFPTHDTAGLPRTGIKFFFKRIDAFIPILPAFIDTASLAADALVKYDIKMPKETERRGLVTSRVGQGIYGKCIIQRWEYNCAVTGFDKLNVLIASHIVPFADSADNERMDVHNRILLSPTYDALFDKHLVTFENSGKISLSNAIDTQAFHNIGVTGQERIRSLSASNHDYLEKHRIRFNENN